MRQKPDFKKVSSGKQGKENDSPSCVWMLIVAVGGYFVFMAVSRVMSGIGSSLDQRICYGVIIGFVILLIMAKWQENQDRIRQWEALQVWKDTSKSADVTIVSRHYSPGGSYEDEYEFPHYARPWHRLELALTDEQRQVFPNLPSIGFDVDEHTYAKLSGKNVARVYYHPEAPMVFLLEEEMEQEVS